MIFNEECTRTFKLILTEAQAAGIPLNGVNVDNPEKSTVPLRTILTNIERGKKSDSESLNQLLAEFFDVVSRSEIHIILGAYRSKCAQAFLVNPCSSGAMDEALLDYFQFINRSQYLGAVLKALYLTNILGEYFPTGHDLFTAVVDNETRPTMTYFTNFVRRVHVDPV